jgi:hypothetical protein
LMGLQPIIAGVGFEPHDLEVMGLASTPGCSTPLYNNRNKRSYKGLVGCLTLMRNAQN